MNAKTAATAKKIVRKLPNRAIEAGAALLIGKALGGNRKLPKLAGTVAALAVTHYVVEWAKDKK